MLMTLSDFLTYYCRVENFLEVNAEANGQMGDTNLYDMQLEALTRLREARSKIEKGYMLNTPYNAVQIRSLMRELGVYEYLGESFKSIVFDMRKQIDHLNAVKAFLEDFGYSK